MGKKYPPLMFTGTGTGKILLRGDGDGGLLPDGEFPVAILSNRRPNGLLWAGAVKHLRD